MRGGYPRMPRGPYGMRGGPRGPYMDRGGMRGMPGPFQPRPPFYPPPYPGALPMGGIPPMQAHQATSVQQSPAAQAEKLKKVIHLRGSFLRC